ncbi:hypothetical protein VP1G_05347 [Cytospora mali]|uniref:Myb-like domain-containing protein n=1 Tax=Cytospora mali TaxID=578113 RepID=A0A194V2F8_CYTMA|nr:hypothetical protein VP1G_05347 [Valsa mali var. pyri (nom. inval.)]
MDTQVVIDLTDRAAESVLRFRVVAFQPRPLLDAKSFHAAIATRIRKVAKDDGNRFETPLADVVRYAGMAASRAVLRWNKISDVENQIDREWFRNCVCDLVSGAVNEIGHKAFQYNKFNASEYLDPNEYDPFDISTYSNDRRNNSEFSSSNADLAPYSFSGGASKQPAPQTRGDDDRAEHGAQDLSIHHEISRGWEAINRLATSHTSNKSTAEFIEATESLSRKHRSPSEHSDASNFGSGLNKPQSKRLRSINQVTTAGGRPSNVIQGADMKRKVVKMPWTEEETKLLFKGREDGKDWDYIHALLPRHTRCACQKKYRDTLKRKESLEASVVAHEKEERVSSPSSGSQGDAEEEVVDDRVLSE